MGKEGCHVARVSGHDSLAGKYILSTFLINFFAINWLQKKFDRTDISKDDIFYNILVLYSINFKCISVAKKLMQLFLDYHINLKIKTQVNFFVSRLQAYFFSLNIFLYMLRKVCGEQDLKRAYFWGPYYWIRVRPVQPWWLSSLEHQLSHSVDRCIQMDGGSNPIQVWCINRLELFTMYIMCKKLSLYK